MCGRARCTLSPQQIARGCGIHSGDGFIATVQMDRFRASYNISPGSYMPVVLARGRDDAAPTVHYMKWGLVPGFTMKTEKPDHFRMFNARSETIQDKASFRRLVSRNRCIVPAEGFYEWKKDGSKKQPYYIHFKDLRSLFFAALYDCWENLDGEILHTFTILTTCSSTRLQSLHDRMPVILGNNDSIGQWLDDSRSNFESLLVPYEYPDLVWYAVTPAIGKISFDGPECIKEIQLKPIVKNLISNFYSMKTQNEVKLGQKIQDSVEAPAAGLFKYLKGETGTEDIDVSNTSLLQVDAKKVDNIFETIQVGLCGYEVKKEGDLSEPKRELCDREEEKECMIKSVANEPMNEAKEPSSEEAKEPSSEEAKEYLNMRSAGKIKGAGGKRDLEKISTSSLPKITTKPSKSSTKKKSRSLKTESDGQPSLLAFLEKYKR